MSKTFLLLSVACDMFSVVVRTQVSINYYKIGVYKRVIILKSRLGLKHITERLGDISTSTSWVLDWFGKTILQKVKEQHIYSSTFGVVYRAKHWDKHIIYNIRNGYTYGAQMENKYFESVIGMKRWQWRCGWHCGFICRGYTYSLDYVHIQILIWILLTIRIEIHGEYIAMYNVAEYEYE